MKKLPLEDECAWNHLALYLRWCLEHELVSEELLKQLLEWKGMDLREVIRTNEWCNGSLKTCCFNELGKKFTKYFYHFNLENTNSYPDCVDRYAKDYFGEERYQSVEFQDEAYLFVPYDETYYLGMKKYIDKAWYEFVNQVEWMS